MRGFFGVLFHWEEVLGALESTCSGLPKAGELTLRVLFRISELLSQNAAFISVFLIVWPFEL